MGDNEPITTREMVQSGPGESTPAAFAFSSARYWEERYRAGGNELYVGAGGREHD